MFSPNCAPSLAYRVDITARAIRNLRRLYLTIDAANAELAHAWFVGLEKAILSLDENPARCPVTPENSALRHLLYGSKTNKSLRAACRRTGSVERTRLRSSSRKD